MAKRNRHGFEFKRKIVEEYEAGLGTAAELGRKYKVHPTNIYQWSQKLRTGALKDGPTKREKELQKQLARAEQKIGQLLIERDLLKKLQEEISQRQRRSAGLRSMTPKQEGSGEPAK
jgi:transposase-like protein